MQNPAVIGTITEIKNNENRVGLTPHGARELVQAGHRVLVQKEAGMGAGFMDSEYTEAGAEIRLTAEEVVNSIDILVKVKEPIPEEYHLLELMHGKILYTYLHLSGVDPELTSKLLANKITGIAYETVKDANGGLPLLNPMSQIAGVLAVQYGAEYLQKKYGGKGKTLGEIEGTQRSNVVIYGAGIVGKTAAKAAAGLGSAVTLFDISDKALEKAKEELQAYLGDYLMQHITLAKPDADTAAKALTDCDLLVGAVLIPGKKAPEVVSEEQVHLIKNGAVIVDVSIDQGGCLWGAKSTTHSKPTYVLDGKIYCCVPNMPGQVAYQSTQALTNATLPYLLKLANEGVEALKKEPLFLEGLNTHQGYITYKSVADDLSLNDKYKGPLDALQG